MSPSHRRGGQPQPTRIRLYLRRDNLDAQVRALLDDKKHYLEQLLGVDLELDLPELTFSDVKAIALGLPTGQRTVRVSFRHEPWGSFARVDECFGGRVVFEVTEGGWIALDEAEDWAALYAAARELPVSRIDAP